MFCSRCGRSILNENDPCPSCGHYIDPAQGAFISGIDAHTSYQSVVHPGDPLVDLEDAVAADADRDYGTVTMNVTNMRYTDDAEQVETDGTVETRTSYRATAHRADDAARNSIHKAVNGEEDDGVTDSYDGDYSDSEDYAYNEDEVDTEDYSEFMVDRSGFVTTEVTASGAQGLSEEVARVFETASEPKPRRSFRFGRKAAEESGDFIDETAAPADAVEEDTDDTVPADAPVDTDEMIDDEDGLYEEDEDYEDVGSSPFTLKRILLIIVAMVVMAALVLGIVTWARNFAPRGKATTIENVRQEFYQSGIEMVKDHASDANTSAILAAYSGPNGGLVALTTSLTQSSADLAALLPEDATENEELFMKALQAIETNIGNCITSDALAIGANDANAIAASDERWTVVNNSLILLENAKSAPELTAIINGETVDIAQIAAEPTPTPAPNYNTLSKGDRSDDVFQLQNRLYELGFFLDDRDGDYGTKTQTAVKMFQQAAGLEPTGIADGATQAALYADDAPRTEFAQPAA